MAEAFKCDRCSQFSDGSPAMEVRSLDAKTGQGGHDQLCSFCRNSFTLWRTAVKDKRVYTEARGGTLDPTAH